MESEILYELQDVSYAYLGRFPALNKMDITITAGEKVVLLGANGSGKSTLLLLLAGLIFPATGSVKFSGQELKEDSFQDTSFQKTFRTKVGVVFQNSDIQLFNSSVEEELEFGLTQLGLSADETRRRLKRYMELMDIEHLKDRHPQYLSVGEKKRVAIAAVLAMEPEVMLLDEPTAGLDPRTSRHLMDTINILSAEQKTVITATQDIHIVAEIADRVVVLGEDKAKAADARAEEVLNDTAFLEKHNLVHAHAHKHKDLTHVHPHEHPDHHHDHSG